jgi:hypothetical protein
MLELLMRKVYERRRWDGVKCHDVSSMTVDSDIQNKWREYTDTHTHESGVIAYFYFFQNKESRLITK